MTRRVDRAFQSPRLVVFESVQSLLVVDLTGDFATRMGDVMLDPLKHAPQALGYALR
jgi:hypothetical protein